MYEYKAIVKKIYDADTITVDIDLGFGIWMMKQSIRFYGIDAPEISGEERPEGLIAKGMLLKWIPVNTEIVIRTHKDAKGKYGRWLGEILVPDVANLGTFININERLVSEGYAKPYMV